MENIRYYKQKSEFDSDLSILSDKTNPHVAYTVETDKAYITPLDDVTAECCMVNIRYKSSSDKYNVFNVTGETIIPEVDYVYEKMYADGTRTTITGSTLSTLNGATLSFKGTNVNTTNGSVTVASRGLNEGPKLFITTSTVTVTINDYSQSSSVNLYQAKNETSEEWLTPSGLVLTVDIIPASGGEISNGTISGAISQVKRYHYGTGEIKDVAYTFTTNDIQDSYYSDPISGKNLENNVSSEKTIGTLTYHYKVNGIWGETSASIKQGANYETNRIYGIPQGLSITSVGVIPASGGTITSAVTSGSIYRYDHLYWKSGFEEDVKMNVTTNAYSWNEVLANSLGTTLTSGQTHVGDIVCTYTDKATSLSNTASAPVYQERNERWEESRYGGIVTYSEVSKGQLSASSTNDISAAGGTIEFSSTSGSQQKYTSAIHIIYRYTSNATDDVIDKSATEDTLTIQGSLSTTSITGEHLGTTETERKHIGTCTCTWNGYADKSASDSYYVYQEANYITNTISSGGETSYGTWTIGSINNATIAAAGGSASATIGNGKQAFEVPAGTITYTWKSGDKSYDTVGGYNGEVDLTPSITSLTATAESRGKETGDTLTIKEQEISWYRDDVFVGTSGTAYVYQEANEEITRWTNSGVTAYTVPTISVTSNSITASGGSATIDLSGSDSFSAETWGQFTSGEHLIRSYSGTAAGSFDWEISTNGNNRFTKNGNKVNHSSMTSYLGTDLCVVKAWNVGEPSKSAVTTVANVSNDIISIDLQVDSSVKLPIPSSGGSISLYALGYFTANPTNTAMVGEHLTWSHTAYTVTASVTTYGGNSTTAARVNIEPNTSSASGAVVVSVVYKDLHDSVEIPVEAGDTRDYYKPLPLYSYPGISGNTGNGVITALDMTYRLFSYQGRFSTTELSMESNYVEEFNYGDSACPPVLLPGFGQKYQDGTMIAAEWSSGKIEFKIPTTSDRIFRGLYFTYYSQLIGPYTATTYGDDYYSYNACYIPVDDICYYHGRTTYQDFVDLLAQRPLDGSCTMPLAFVIDYAPKTIQIQYRLQNKSGQNMQFGVSLSLDLMVGQGQSTGAVMNYSKSPTFISPDDYVSDDIRELSLSGVNDTSVWVHGLQGSIGWSSYDSVTKTVICRIIISDINGNVVQPTLSATINGDYKNVSWSGWLNEGVALNKLGSITVIFEGYDYNI